VLLAAHSDVHFVELEPKTLGRAPLLSQSAMLAFLSMPEKK